MVTQNFGDVSKKMTSGNEKSGVSLLIEKIETKSGVDKGSNAIENILSGIEQKNKSIFADKYSTKQTVEERLSEIEQGIVKTDSINESIKKNFDVAEFRRVRKEYIENVRSCSEFPNGINKKKLELEKWEKQCPEITARQREDFDFKKSSLKKQWEERNGVLWPKYKEDVYSSNGNLIRKKGADYDAHHVKPLSMGGKNDVDNITPIHARDHYDKQGVHAPGSPYDRLEKMLEVANE